MYSLPSKPEKITSDWLFDRIRQEDVYLFYLGFCELNKKFTNPLRTDKKADCTFYWHNGVLFFRDFAAKKSYTCISMIMELKHITYFTALDEIYNKFIKSQNSNLQDCKSEVNYRKVKAPTDIQVKIQPFTKIDIEYLKSFGITSELCKKYHVYSILYYWTDGILLYAYSKQNPCLGYYFNGKWKLYKYKALSYRFVCNTSHEDLQGYDQLDWIGNVCVITKSMKDVILYRRFGINAVAPHSEVLSKWKQFIPILQKRFKRVVINFDNDKAGHEATQDILDEFPDLEIFFVEEAKDPTDFYKAFGEEKTKQLLKNYE